MTAVVDELAALLAAATPGPWTAGRCKHPATKFAHAVVSSVEGQLADVDESMRSEADAALIAAMRNHLPDLLAQLAAVTAERDAADAKVAAVEGIWAAWTAWDGSLGPDGRSHPDSSSPRDRDRLRAALDTQPTATEEER